MIMIILSGRFNQYFDLKMDSNHSKCPSLMALTQIVPQGIYIKNLEKLLLIKKIRDDGKNQNLGA